jgi:hypothetical protein
MREAVSETAIEAAHENAQKTPDNFFVTVGDVITTPT